MTSISNEDFIKFLKNYENPKYFDTIEDISWPKDKYGHNIPGRDPLISNQFKMLSLDDICKDCSKFDKNNIPSTTDALWYNEDDDGKLVLYFIEFKWHNLDRLNRDKSPVDADVSFKLRLKPFESLFIVLPKLFEEYCETNDKDFKGLDDFLRTCEIKVYSFVYTFYRGDGGIRSNNNKTTERIKNNRYVGPKGSIGSTIHKQYKRMELTPFIDFADIYQKSCFEDFLEIEGLK